MKSLRYIVSLLTLCIVALSCEREDNPHYPIEGSGRPIVFAVESEWPEISKAAINNVEDIKNFRVWGTWNPDPSTPYYPEESVPAYGIEGSQVVLSGHVWQCVNEAEWYPGYYNFAALAHLQLSGTYSSSFSKNTLDGVARLEYTNTLNFKFPSEKYNLGASQLDCMYAFINEDNSTNTSSTVNFNFEHLFSLLTINIAANKTTELSPKLDVTIYGIHNSITGPVTITQTEVITNYGTQNQQRTVSVTNNLKDLLKNSTPSTESSTYKKVSYTNEGYGSVDFITPVSQLIVFPENLEETPLTIKVDFKDEAGTITKTLTATINSGEWQSGRSYAYTLLTN